MLKRTDLKDGYHNLTWEEYHAIDAVRHSWLEALRRSPAACQLAMGGDAAVESKSLRVGRALHAAVLEPLSFLDEYIKWQHKGTTKEGKAERAKALEENKTGLTGTEWDSIEGMSASLKTNPIAARLLNTATDSERTILWTLQGRRCKSKLDLQGDKWVVDIKTVRDIGRFSPGSVTAYGYHRQAGWYTTGMAMVDGVPPEHFYFLVVANTPPHESAVYRLELESLNRGVDEALEGFSEFVKHEGNGTWTKHMALLLEAKSFPPREEETTPLWR